MSELILPDDSRYFTQTSDKLYDRHHYKVVSDNGDEVIVDNWEDANTLWWNKKKFLSHIDILDISKGFS